MRLSSSLLAWLFSSGAALVLAEFGTYMLLSYSLDKGTTSMFCDSFRPLSFEVLALREGEPGHSHSSLDLHLLSSLSCASVPEDFLFPLLVVKNFPCTISSGLLC